MKTAFYLIATCFISTGIYITALNSSNAAPGILLAMAVWAWFLWGCEKRSREKTAARERERRLNYWLRQMHRRN